jgi:hypothetical protein
MIYAADSPEFRECMDVHVLVVVHMAMVARF